MSIIIIIGKKKKKKKSVKVWTVSNYLIYELKDQSNAAVTGLVIPNADGKVPPQPFLIACYADGMIRMWNIEAGYCSYRFIAFLIIICCYAYIYASFKF